MRMEEETDCQQFFICDDQQHSPGEGTGWYMMGKSGDFVGGSAELGQDHLRAVKAFKCNGNTRGGKPSEGYRQVRQRTFRQPVHFLDSRGFCSRRSMACICILEEWQRIPMSGFVMNTFGRI